MGSLAKRIDLLEHRAKVSKGIRIFNTGDDVRYWETTMAHVHDPRLLLCDPDGNPPEGIEVISGDEVDAIGQEGYMCIVVRYVKDWTPLANTGATDAARGAAEQP